jgi:hypothetical protein
MDDRLAERVRRKAAAEGLAVSAFIAKTLDDALKRTSVPAARPFWLVTVKGESVLPGRDLDRPRTLDIEEDESRYAARRRR